MRQSEAPSLCCREFERRRCCSANPDSERVLVQYLAGMRRMPFLNAISSASVNGRYQYALARCCPRLLDLAAPQLPEPTKAHL
jgi:hypothetical protein